MRSSLEDLLQNSRRVAEMATRIAEEATRKLSDVVGGALSRGWKTGVKRAKVDLPCRREWRRRDSFPDVDGGPAVTMVGHTAGRPGDAVVVVKLDGFARSSRDLSNRFHELNELGIGFLLLRMTGATPRRCWAFCCSCFGA